MGPAGTVTAWGWRGWMCSGGPAPGSTLPATSRVSVPCPSVRMPRKVIRLPWPSSMGRGYVIRELLFAAMDFEPNGSGYRDRLQVDEQGAGPAAGSGDR